VDAVAEILGVAPNTVGIWIRTGVIPAAVVYQLRKGAPYMLEEGSFWEWIDSTRIDRTDVLPAMGDASPAPGVVA
jgi:hypothetical protein